MEIMKYRADDAEHDGWVVEESRFDSRYLGKCESIFCQGNGYMGVRCALEEEYVGETRGMFVNGTFNKFDVDEVTELPNLPDVTKWILTFNGRRFHMDAGRVSGYRRVLNLKNGEVTRELEWESPDGDRVGLRFSRFVSLADEHVMGSRVTVRALSGELQIGFQSGIDGRVSNTGSQHFHEGEKRLLEGRYLEMVSRTTQSEVSVAIDTTHRFWVNGCETELRLLPVIERRFLSVKGSVSLGRGEEWTAEKLSVVYTTRDLACEEMEAEKAVEYCRAAGRAAIREAAQAGYAALFQESAGAWESFWNNQDIRITGSNPFDQLAVRFALYHLTIMTKAGDPRMGIGAKGLSGEGYKGHSFWDTEIFIFPYFLYTRPETARALLEYRYKGLVGARRKAAENGYEGAMYPWESAWIDDGEVTPLWGAADVVTGEATPILTGRIEQHISADVAYAVWEYYQVTGDRDFMERCGYEIILSTAIFWASRVEWNETAGRFEINDVIGPDEYKEHVNNNAYTNYLAHHNLMLAIQIAQELSGSDAELYAALDQKLNLAAHLPGIRSAAGKLYLPQPDGNGIIPQFDGYLDLKHIDLTPYQQSSVVGTIYNDYNMEQINGMQVSKQADLVVLFYLLGDQFPDAIQEKNYHFYEARTLHDSSLSRSTHCVLACQLGLKEVAYRFYQGASAVDLGPEMRSSDAGIHSASMGGVWQSIVMGFGGVHMVNGQLHLSPSLPEQWESLSFPLVWQGTAMQVSVTNDAVQVENRGTQPLSLTVYGEDTVVPAGEAKRFAATHQKGENG